MKDYKALISTFTLLTLKLSFEFVHAERSRNHKSSESLLSCERRPKSICDTGEAFIGTRVIPDINDCEHACIDLDGCNVYVYEELFNSCMFYRYCYSEFACDTCTMGYCNGKDMLECVSWRQSIDCSADGPPDPENDKPCNDPLWWLQNVAGYCECANGVKRMEAGCNTTLDYQTCTDACRGFDLCDGVTCSNPSERCDFCQQYEGGHCPNDGRCSCTGRISDGGKSCEGNLQAPYCLCEHRACGCFCDKGNHKSCNFPDICVEEECMPPNN